MSARLTSALVLLLVPALAGVADAQRRGAKARGPAPACDIAYLPLVEGTVWKYGPTTPEEPPEQKGLTLEDPPEVTIEVIKVESSRTGAEITLRESHRKFSRETRLRCDRDGLYVDPQSFFFAAEVGGGLAMELSSIDRQRGPTWPGAKAMRNGASWREEVTADVERRAAEGSEAKHDAGKMEIEREAVVRRSEFVESGMTEHPRAFRVEVGFTGRAYVSAREKPVAMPSSRATIWFDSGVGIVRADNRLGQGWKLTEHTRPD
jgi:hypothetical protein